MFPITNLPIKTTNQSSKTKKGNKRAQPKLNSLDPNVTQSLLDLKRMEDYSANKFGKHIEIKVGAKQTVETGKTMHGSQDGAVSSFIVQNSANSDGPSACGDYNEGKRSKAQER